MGKHLTLGEAANRMGVDTSALRHAIRRGRLRGFKGVRGEWLLTPAEFRRYVRLTGAPPVGYVTAAEAARMMGRTRQRVHQMIDAGQMPARRTPDGRVFVPVDAVGGSDDKDGRHGSDAGGGADPADGVPAGGV